ncbi:hypothetical protein T10_1305 [Trichinella papuae]|uniref:Uncharacterized protein n=1 Tax=Trichinella papuae TaxID=268474 RepID=A0A0V1N7T7_9BILA|nr:hypothetical protein T10_1305 [Trichinella papuae]
MIVRVWSLILSSISESTARISYWSALLRRRTLDSDTVTHLTSRSQYPLHHGALRVELPLDVFISEISINHLPLVAADERLQETSGLMECPEVVRLDELWLIPPRNVLAERTQKAIHGHLNDQL